MSVAKYGRITPIQGEMLGLGGEIVDRPFESPSDEDKLAEMRASRAELSETTGQDFGYDLAAWHHFLLSSSDHSKEYTFPYAWKAVRAKILELIEDPNRLRLVRALDLTGE